MSTYLLNITRQLEINISPSQYQVNEHSKNTK